MKLKKDGALIVISGPSGVGKNTICDELLKRNPGIYLSISMTSRDIRPNEIDGKNYYFVSTEEFENNIAGSNLLEYAKVHDEYYGTPKNEVINRIKNGIDVILTIDVQGAINIKRMYPDSVLIFLMPPDMATLKDRLVNRKTETKDNIIKRLNTAYNEINEISKYDYVVINDDVLNAVSKIESILISEKSRVKRIEDLELEEKEKLIQNL